MKEFGNVKTYMDSGLYHYCRENSIKACELQKAIEKLYKEDNPVLVYTKEMWESGLNLPNYISRNNPELVFLKDADSFFKYHKNLLNQLSKDILVIVEAEEHSLLLHAVPACGILLTSNGIEIYSAE